MIRVIVQARHERTPVVPKLMEEFGFLEHQAKYHYTKVTKKGLVPTRRDGHAPRIAIMFLNSANEERIELCQVCKTPWPCVSERLRRRTAAGAGAGAAAGAAAGAGAGAVADRDEGDTHPGDI